MANNHQNNELEQNIIELTADLQRIQADFINYRRRVEEERQMLSDTAKAATIIKLLPIIDDIDRAITHTPPELADNKWVQGITSLAKNLQKSLLELGITRITAQPGTLFDPNLHEAVSMDDGEGDQEVISEELRAGYKLGNQVVRPAMVKVTKQPAPDLPNPNDTVAEQLKDEPPEIGGPED